MRPGPGEPGRSLSSDLTDPAPLSVGRTTRYSKELGEGLAPKRCPDTAAVLLRERVPSCPHGLRKAGLQAAGPARAPRCWGSACRSRTHAQLGTPSAHLQLPVCTMPLSGREGCA